jgi:CRISPR-associated protein Cmr4
LFLTAESPVHAGADTSTGVVDMPIQREKATELPVIWGQSLKGALRERARKQWADRAGRVVEVFGSVPPGSDKGSAGDSGGSLKPGTVSIGDAQLVLFPVPTEERTFCWVTSGLALTRLRRKTELVGVTAPRTQPEVLRDAASSGTRSGRSGEVILGQYVVGVETSDPTTEWAKWLADTALPRTGGHAPFRTKMTADTVAVSDSLLGQLSVECAELVPRIQLEADVKTVKHGPFYTEYLPTDSVMAALLETDHPADVDDLIALVDGQVLRLGGDETIGKGLMWCRLFHADAGAGR